MNKMEEEYLNKIIEPEGIKYSPLEGIKKNVHNHKTAMSLPVDGDYLKSSKEK